ncbi:MAG TPA: cytochrome c-type biogenesis protein CcmH [Ktedonobacteraceae bacterium]|jgi:cytochrome c-type biogenesis protein CcmH|nr:cytochrome c-type biogenesis protein CcmH [Ktedonobacteraceae bacterium]
MKQKRSLLVILAVVAILGATWSHVLLTTPPQKTLDQEVQDVGSQLKCLVCQGESVADSPALLAQQMRAVIRQQLQSGKSEQDVIQYFQARYGDKILFAPPQRGFDLLAWLVPVAMLLAGALLLFFVVRDWHTSSRGGAEQEDSDLTGVDEAEMERYRRQLEQELADDDPLFAQSTIEEAG